MADTPFSYKELHFPERLQKKKSEIEIPLIVIAVCVDPIYYRWVFYNFRIFFSSASSFIKLIVILLCGLVVLEVGLD